MTRCKHGMPTELCSECQPKRARLTVHNPDGVVWESHSRKCANCGGRMYSQLQQHRTLCRKCERKRAAT